MENDEWCTCRTLLETTLGKTRRRSCKMTSPLWFTQRGAGPAEATDASNVEEVADVFGTLRKIGRLEARWMHATAYVGLYPCGPVSSFALLHLRAG